jgi:hypothetical protein
MSERKMDRERRIFVWGIVGIILISFGVAVPLAYFTGQGATIFFLEILVITAWMIWYERARKKAAHDK